MKTNLSLLFFLKKPKNYSDGPLTIYLRFTVNNMRAEASTGKLVHPSQWNQSSGRVKGTKEEVRTVNNYLAVLRNKALEIHKDLTLKDLPVTSERIKKEFI